MTASRVRWAPVASVASRPEEARGCDHPRVDRAVAGVVDHDEAAGVAVGEQRRLSTLLAIACSMVRTNAIAGPG
jgi:hypothetical protein